MTSNDFFSKPVLNSPYEYPARHWELEDGHPTSKILPKRRPADFVTPFPKPKKRRADLQQELPLGVEGVSTTEQQYDPAPLVNELRQLVHHWRQLPNARDWGVTPETARLLRHWRTHEFESIRPFFCQIEAVETAIWLTEVAPKNKAWKDKFLRHLENANEEANPGLPRLALKLATGAGKTMVMAMLIAWQTINAVRRTNSKMFSRGFLIVTPGLTIRDRLRVLQPNDPDSYYQERELVPNDLLAELGKAKIVITNYHAFKLRETLPLSRGNRSLLQGRGPELQTLETEAAMIKRVLGDLMGMKNILALNDEAHHCYREKPGEDEEGPLKGEARREAKKNKEAARLWISGLEAVQRKLGLGRIIDLSATPFFLRGSGYAEGSLFPWTMSDFSLMDAIECGIVKVPRIPVADNMIGQDIPVFRNLWDHIGKKMPKKGRGKAGVIDPLAIPAELQGALEALYGHYEKTFHAWEKERVEAPPCFIVVCNNTSTSKLIYDYISGFYRSDGRVVQGRLDLLRNFDANNQPLARPRTLLIDSEQLESGEALDPQFRKMAGPEIERFRREIRQRGNAKDADQISDQDLLREVMNTVGKAGRLGGEIRCVVSVSMLTEGWDANTVTHILGVRAFGTQLLCEQVIGRALRRQSYDLNEAGLFNAEYADIFGIPFDFTDKPVVAKVQPPRESIQVRALRERQHLEITFPRVEGYRVDLPNDRLSARFNGDSTLELTPELVGPTITQNQGIIGEAIDFNLVHTNRLRRKTLVYHLTKRLLETKWRDSDGEPKLHLFGQLKRITETWLDGYLDCQGGTYPAQLMFQELADRACERIHLGIRSEDPSTERPIRALLDPYNPKGSSRHVRFSTSKRTRHDTRKSHVNWVVCDSDWESELCRVVESHPRVVAYVKNQGLGFEVPYLLGAEARHYRPDFILLVDDARGDEDLLNLVVEIKGYRREGAKDKKATMERRWIPGVNRLETFGRWAFAELTEVYRFEEHLDAKIKESFHLMIDSALGEDAPSA